MKESEIFVDSLLAISLRDGVIRMEFGEVKGAAEEGAENATDGEEKNIPDTILKHRMFITMPGFVRSLNMMQEVMKRLKEQGMIVEKQETPSQSGKPFVAEASSNKKLPPQK